MKTQYFVIYEFTFHKIKKIDWAIYLRKASEEMRLASALNPTRSENCDIFLRGLP